MGCFFFTVPIYGLLNSIGLFQTYWREHQLQDFPESEVSWIMSMSGFMDCLFRSPAGILFDKYGIRWLLPLASIMYLSCFVGLAFSSNYGGFMGCQAMAGVCVAVPTTLAFAIVSQWFKAHKGLAVGCVTMGAAVGGIFFSLILKVLFERFEWGTAVPILTGMQAGFFLLGNLLVETNLSRRPLQDSGWDLVEARRMSRSPKFWLVSYLVFLARPLTRHMRSMRVDFFVLDAVIGRSLPLWLSDRKLGPLNTVILMMTATLFVVLVIWLPFGTSSVTALLVVVVLLGIGTGSLVPLGVACVSALCGPEIIGTWVGLVYSVASIATLIDNPSTGAILERFEGRGLVVFLAIVLFTRLANMTALRWLRHGRRWKFVDKI
ncbi:major facilitator superfamily domain-containing protein [Schizothecium vesticola]|uniref:Major facilitator superfamily domain-containing protein n=1 Tax=Schizothecium vesticola TaxID=314040 RepID=A0AA40KAK3_9PEZI|nr:major facilitator superfamily domain-containing protein [Schizothecium vesticola]